MSWQVQWTNRAIRSVKRLDRPTRLRIVEAIEQLAETGRGDLKRLRGRSPEDYRLRVGGWRVLLSRIEPDRILVIRSVLSRGDAY